MATTSGGCCPLSHARPPGTAKPCRNSEAGCGPHNKNDKKPSPISGQTRCRPAVWLCPRDYMYARSTECFCCRTLHARWGFFWSPKKRKKRKQGLATASNGVAISQATWSPRKWPLSFFNANPYMLYDSSTYMHSLALFRWLLLCNSLSFTFLPFFLRFFLW